MSARRLIDPDELRRYADAGELTAAVAAKTGFHPRSILKAAQRIGVKLREEKRVDPEQVRELAHLRAPEIAKRLGFTRATIRKVAARHNITMLPAYQPNPVRAAPGEKSSQFWKENFAQCLEWKNDGVSIREIARRIGRTPGAVIGAFDRAGCCKRKHSPPPPPAFPERGHCAYPLWGEEKPTYEFCGADVAAFGTAYCAIHHSLCYKPAAQGEAA